MALRRDGDRWAVTATHALDYEVGIVPGWLDGSAPAAKWAGLLGPATEPGRRRVVIADRLVWEIYGERIAARLEDVGIAHEVTTLALDETSKSLGSAEAVAQVLKRARIRRRSEPPIAVGGGVLLDVVGVTASLYGRGIDWYRVPTTLVGQVDAGIGAKTGVDWSGAKNKLGSYHPAHTLIDPAFLATVPVRRLSDGLAEILKVGVMRDRELVELLDQHGRALIRERFGGALAGIALDVLRAAIDGMLCELAPNLDERASLMRLMDYGHTWGPRIEMEALPSLLHGESVALDMALSTVVANRRGLITAEERARLLRITHALGLPLWDPVMTIHTVWAGLREQVVHRNGQQHVPLPAGIGGATFVEDVTRTELAAALDELQVEAAALGAV